MIVRIDRINFGISELHFGGCSGFLHFLDDLRIITGKLETAIVTLRSYIPVSTSAHQ